MGQDNGEAMAHVGVRLTAQLGAWWKKNITCFDWGDHGNEPQRFEARAFDTVHFAFSCYDDVARGDLNRVALFVDLILAMTGENSPCVLAFRMRVGSNGLTRLDMPSDDD